MIEDKLPLSFAVKNTFCINMAGVQSLCLMTGDQVAVCTDSGGQCLLEVYNLNDGQLIWSLTQEGEFIGTTEVSLGGKPCLAISLWYVRILCKQLS